MGEAGLGLLNGVIATRPGFLDGGEVVEVRYDPEVISRKALEDKAKIKGCQACRAGEIRPDKEPKYYLSRTLLRFVPMTPAQATRINGMLDRPERGDLLSPSQQRLLKAIEAHPDAGWENAIGQDLVPAWRKAEAVRAHLE